MAGAVVIKPHTSKGGKTSWQVYSRVTGVKKYVGSYGTEREARHALQDHEVRQRAIARGELPAEVDERRTLTQACTEWIESLKKRGSRSWDTHEFRLNTHILPVLGGRPVERIQQTDVMALRDALAPTRAPRTVNAAITTLSAAFTEFRRRKWVAGNPCHDVDHLEVPERDYNWLKTADEISRVIAACNEESRDFVAVLFGTGMRFAEALHLHHADVDVPKRLITVHRGARGPCKSNRVRRIPILDSVLPVFRRLALNRAGSALVFPGPRGKVRSQSAVRGAFKRALVAAGLDPTLRVHDARHSYASHWMMNSGDLWVLSRVLGHSSVTVTEKFYAHLRPEQFIADYGRVVFTMPGELADVVPLRG